MNLLQLEQCATEELASVDNRLVAAYLFGSVARGTDSSDSDVDVGILLRTAPSGDLNDLRFELEGNLERVLGQRTQVVILGADPLRGPCPQRVLRSTPNPEPVSQA